MLTNKVQIRVRTLLGNNVVIWIKLPIFINIVKSFILVHVSLDIVVLLSANTGKSPPL